LTESGDSAHRKSFPPGAEVAPGRVPPTEAPAQSGLFVSRTNCNAPDPPLLPGRAGGARLSYIKGAPKDAVASKKDQAVDLPKELEQGLPEPPPEPRGSVVPQPISISLNRE